MKITIIIMLIPFYINAQHIECTHKMGDWNEWNQIKTTIDIDEARNTIRVKEVENVETIIRWNEIFIDPAGSKMYLWNKTVVAVFPNGDNAYLVSIYRNNYICPLKQNE